MVGGEQVDSQVRNILIVSQSDQQLVPILRKVIPSLSMYPNHKTMRVFSVGDLGVESLPWASNAVLRSAEYIRRGALSWGLCTPEFAESYMGESWSGFTLTLYAGA